MEFNITQKEEVKKILKKDIFELISFIDIKDETALDSYIDNLIIKLQQHI